MTKKAVCSILSFDYLDLDVYLNVRIFYRLAGYTIHPLNYHPKTSLLVVLRGQPQRVFSEYSGVVHHYDYVLEHSLDIRDYFPNASRIFSISLSTIKPSSDNDKYIHSYLPVYPSLWQFGSASSRRNSTSLHISNYKPIVNDPYQKQLLSMICAGKVIAYGAKWESQNISTKQLSYLSSNVKLAHSSHCFGLMYPYQRGKSLSGRMWQAPINGCYVISERGTNIYNVPGVIEVDAFLNSYVFSSAECSHLAWVATQFWISKTSLLARDLDLQQSSSSLSTEILLARILLLRNHILFLWEKRFLKTIFSLKRLVRRSTRLHGPFR